MLFNILLTATLELFKTSTVYAFHLTAENAFIFKLNCSSWDSTKCNQAKESLSQVGSMIGTQIRFLVPVTVCVAIVQQDDLGIFIFDQGISKMK